MANSLRSYVPFQKNSPSNLTQFGIGLGSVWDNQSTNNLGPNLTLKLMPFLGFEGVYSFRRSIFELVGHQSITDQSGAGNFELSHFYSAEEYGPGIILNELRIWVKTIRKFGQ